MNLLLLGAGFSRNWGGWLVDELTGDLLARLEDDPDLTRRLRQATGGFESLLAELQQDRRSSDAAEARYQAFQKVVIDSFGEMNRHFANTQTRFEWSNDGPGRISDFLAKFDAIFTLNQDVLLEAKYEIPMQSSARYNSIQYPGLNTTLPSVPSIPVVISGNSKDYYGTPQPESEFKLENKSQPIFKLHGSVHWKRADGQSVLVMGGNKGEYIEKEPLLRWYHEQFKEKLNAPRSRLMIIGYAFQDLHINNALLDATAKGDLRVYLVDPRGTQVLQSPTTDHSIGNGGSWTMETLRLIGVTRRTIDVIFREDQLEHAKLLRFFK